MYLPTLVSFESWLPHGTTSSSNMVGRWGGRERGALSLPLHVRRAFHPSYSFTSYLAREEMRPNVPSFFPERRGREVSLHRCLAAGASLLSLVFGGHANEIPAHEIPREWRSAGARCLKPNPRESCSMSPPVRPLNRQIFCGKTTPHPRAPLAWLCSAALDPHAYNFSNPRPSNSTPCSRPSLPSYPKR